MANRYRARSVKRRSTFRARGEGVSKLDQNARWIAKADRQRPPLAERSSQVRTHFDAIDRFATGGWKGWLS